MLAADASWSIPSHGQAVFGCTTESRYIAHFAILEKMQHMGVAYVGLML